MKAAGIRVSPNPAALGTTMVDAADRQVSTFSGIARICMAPSACRPRDMRMGLAVA